MLNALGLWLSPCKWRMLPGFPTVQFFDVWQSEDYWGMRGKGAHFLYTFLFLNMCTFLLNRFVNFPTPLLRHSNPSHTLPVVSAIATHDKFHQAFSSMFTYILQSKLETATIWCKGYLISKCSLVPRPPTITCGFVLQVVGSWAWEWGWC